MTISSLTTGSQHGSEKLQCDKSCFNYSLYMKIENRVFYVLGRKCDEPGRYYMLNILII